MITWMQQHKKWLVVTIWISTIAFVGAGMVGWGAYSFGAGEKVAQVGRVGISIADYNRKYSQVYGELAELLGGNIDQEIAKKEGVPEIALNQLIQQALLENLALDLGIRVSDEEVAKMVATNPVFATDGAFDKELYKRILAENNLRPSEFEASLKKGLLGDKLLALIPFEGVSALEVSAVGAAVNVKDTIEYKVLGSADAAVAVGDLELRDFWAQNKQKWSAPLKFSVEYVLTKAADVVPTEEEMREFYAANKAQFVGLDGQVLSYEAAKNRVKAQAQVELSSTQAKRDFVALRDKKDGIRVFSASLKESDSSVFGADTKESSAILAALSAAREGDVLEPMAVGVGEFVSMRVVSKSAREPKSFEAAKSEALAELRAQKKADALRKKADAELAKGFAGARADGVSRFYAGQLAGLTETQKFFALEQIFARENPVGAVFVDDKAVLYRVVKQDFVAPSQEELATFGSIVSNFKARTLSAALLEYLNKKYETKILMEL